MCDSLVEGALIHLKQVGKYMLGVREYFVRRIFASLLNGNYILSSMILDAKEETTKWKVYIFNFLIWFIKLKQIIRVWIIYIFQPILSECNYNSFVF